MPLVIVTGLPTSGKSTRASQLWRFLTTKVAGSTQRIHLISDDSLSISRGVYDLSPKTLPANSRSANASEKDARASMYGAVKRVLSDRDFVILDGLNYIKGWRYQLHCEAKAVQTPSCILQIGCSIETARQVNESRLEKLATNPRRRSVEAYASENWDNLVFRYEEPNPMTRWDSPLFTLIWEDDDDRVLKVFNDLWNVMAGSNRKTILPNQATIQKGQHLDGEHLYLLDRETLDVVRQILNHEGPEGGELIIDLGDGRTGSVVELTAGKKLVLPQLQRLRRAYMGLNRGGIGLEPLSNMTSGQIRKSFVRYLNETLENVD